jgi:hypothetical protein
MAASLSSAQPANPRQQALSRTNPSPLVDDLMMTSRHVDACFFILFEPRQGGKAQRIFRDVAEHQAMPRSSLVDSSDVLSEIGQPLVKLRVRLQSEHLDRKCLGLDWRQLLAGISVDR